MLPNGKNGTSGFMVAKLSADCTKIEGAPTTIADVQHEGPAVFQVSRLI